MRIPSIRLARLAALAAASALTAVAGCGPAAPRADWADVREVTPASLEQRAASDPSLASDGGARVALTFVTRDTTGGRDLWLALSRDSGRTFGAPVRVNRATGRVSSYAESRPLAAWGAGGRLAVAWSERRADTSGAVDLMVRASGDGGATFGAPRAVHDDSLGRPTFHGFPALAWLPDGTLFAAWMDGRAHADSVAESVGSLFTSRSPDGGRSWEPNAAVTDSLCPCCRVTAIGLGEGRLALAYRSAAGGVRDPAIAFSSDGGRTFTPERPLSADHWVLDACPSDGPALAASDPAGHAVWTTGAAPAGVYLAPWGFGVGPTGPRRALLDSLTRAAHPCAAPFGASMLIAVEGLPRGDSVSVVAVRALDPGDTLTPWVFLGAHARDAGLAPVGPHAALVVWVERAGALPRVRLARLTRLAQHGGR